MRLRGLGGHRGARDADELVELQRERVVDKQAKRLAHLRHVLQSHCGFVDAERARACRVRRSRTARWAASDP
jgi:hypothetical protein